MAGYLITERQGRVLHDCLILTIQALQVANRLTDAATVLELYNRINTCGGLAKMTHSDITNIIAVLRLHQQFAAAIPNATSESIKTDVADLLVLFTAALQAIDQKIVDVKAKKQYPCDLNDSCPYNATYGKDCAQHCGLGVAEDKVDEAVKAKKPYTCGLVASCPYNATNGKDCLQHCGLIADEEEVDEADAN